MTLLLPEGLPRLSQVTVTSESIFLALLCAVASGIFVGLFSASGSTSTTNSTLGTRWSQRGAAQSHARLRRIIVGELALTTALLVITGLLLTTFFNVQSVPLGYRVNDIGVAEVHMPIGEEEAVVLDFQTRLLDLVRRLPAVDKCALTSSIPLRPRDYHLQYGWKLRKISPGFFGVIGARIVKGRGFSGKDSQGSERVAVLNDRAAAVLAQDSGEALGQLVMERYRVVGIVEDIRYVAPDQEPAPAIYLNYLQSPDPRLALIVRSKKPLPIMRQISVRVKDISSNQPVTRIAELGDLYRTSGAFRERAAMLKIVGAFAALASLLGAFGIYVFCSFQAAAHRGEYGLRLALGDSPTGLSWLIVRTAMASALTQILCGKQQGVRCEHPTKASVPGSPEPFISWFWESSSWWLWWC